MDIIRPIKPSDCPAVCDIYNYYILHSVVTFEEDLVTIDDMTERINNVVHKLPWLIFEQNAQILGYAYAKEWNSRSAYRHTAETTIYLDHQAIGKGIGKSLYSELLNILKAQNIHTVIGGIALPNKGSIGLHESLGYNKVAHFAEVGYKFDQWIDVAYWQKNLD